ncbi:Hypothetical protein R9X50_00271000 [Acrodontium crateriforme]|uniref:Yeast cell wall synthesis Kre9/Knh1 C-terminal domain-containing protein n=1 Tax=Acrodontium crateriforme TaxID=150365 RepID=A0AAQ3M4T2_9PEZI|nr:Hypothetical protein R9X50_00271000 [Acrodontium crateriforme]
MRFSGLLVAAVAAPCALAKPIFSTVGPFTASLTAGTTVTIKDDGKTPTFSQLKDWTVTLFVGGNTPGDAATAMNLGTMGTANTPFTQTTSVDILIAPGLAGSTPNGYYLQIMSSLTDGGLIFTFSNRFSVTGMTGTTPEAMVAAAEAAGTTPPAEIDQSGTAAAAVGGAQFDVPYGQQTGLTKWAPMQPIPPTKITQTQFTPLNPTSAATLATTFLGAADVSTTLTASQTFSVKSRENPAAAASMPTQANNKMAKFLARWTD